METINSIPVALPSFAVHITTSPTHGVVFVANQYAPDGEYAWQQETIPGYPAREALPAVYYHYAEEEITFTCQIMEPLLRIDVAEYYWDFGDGTYDTGNPTQHTYNTVNPGIITHVRVTDTQGRRSYASLNMMLVTQRFPWWRATATWDDAETTWNGADDSLET